MACLCCRVQAFEAYMQDNLAKLTKKVADLDDVRAVMATIREVIELFIRFSITCRLAFALLRLQALSAGWQQLVERKDVQHSFFLSLSLSLSKQKVAL
jgi:hypothetical protein